MKQGEFKNLVDSLVGKFHGAPDGLVVVSLEPEHLKPFENSTTRYDLLHGKFSSAIDPANPLAQILTTCQTWFKERLKQENAISDVTEAHFELIVGKFTSVDKSQGQMFQNSDVKRDSAGRTYVDKIPVKVPEWQAVPTLSFQVNVKLVARGKEYTHQDKSGQLRFMPERR